MKREKNFYIKGSVYAKPSSGCTIYVDGMAGDEFREEIDIELSHWLPNRTPLSYKAGTSTEICFKFLDASPTYPYDLVINNHLDIDGILSVFALAYPTFSLQKREIICQAAQAGDFWAWSEGQAFYLFQELTLLYQKIEKQKIDGHKAYEICFEKILNILTHNYCLTHPLQQVSEEQFHLIEQGHIERIEISPWFILYHIPKTLTQGKVQSYLGAPKFNEPISKRLRFWPQVRNRLDQEKIHLVAIESEKGIYYELWYPGYVWADTRDLWIPPGLLISKDMKKPHLLNWLPLNTAINDLNIMEKGRTFWKIFKELNLFGHKNPREFPIVASTLDKQNNQKESQLSLKEVINVFQKYTLKQQDYIYRNLCTGVETT